MEDAWIKLYFKTFDNMKSSELNKIMRLLNFPDRFKSGKTKCARFAKRNVQISGKTKRYKKIAHTTL